MTGRGTSKTSVGPVTGNVLVSFARINPKDGLWEIYNRPWEKSHFAGPFISDVDYLEACSVTQAVFDSAKEALIVTLIAGPVESSTVSFTVRQLETAKTYELIKDEKSLGNISKKDPLPPGTLWQGDGSLLITTALREQNSFIIKAK